MDLPVKSIDDAEPTRVLYYSQPGTFKTTAAAHISAVVEHVAWIDSESSFKPRALVRFPEINLDRVRQVPIADQTYLGLQKIFSDVSDAIDEGTSWGVGIDTITNLQARMLTQAVDESAKTNPGRRGDKTKPHLEDYGTNTEHLRRLIRQIVDVDCHLVVCAHVKDEMEEDSPGSNNRVRTGAVIPAVTDKFGETLFGLMDVVVYGDVIKGQRVGFMVPTAERTGKERYGSLPVVMPEPSFDRIHGYLNGTLTGKTDPIYKAFRKDNLKLIERECRRAGRPEFYTGTFVSGTEE